MEVQQTSLCRFLSILDGNRYYRRRRRRTRTTDGQFFGTDGIDLKWASNSASRNNAVWQKINPLARLSPESATRRKLFFLFFTEKWIYKQVCRGKYPEREKSLCCIILCNTSSRPEMPMQKTGETEPAFSMMSAFYY